MAVERSALLVVDMQNDFCLPSAPLFVPGAPAVIAAVIAAVDAARARGVPVVWVVREHHVSGVDAEVTRAHLYKDGKGPVALLTPGSELVDGLHPAAGEHVISKKRFSAFWGSHLASLLRRLAVGHVVLAGVQTPNCIRATAFDAVSEDFPAVSVLADATASATDAVQAANLHDLRAVGVNTPTLAEWKATLGGGGLVALLFGK